MNDILQDKLYLAILQKAAQIQPNPKGLSYHQPQGKADSVMINKITL